MERNESGLEALTRNTSPCLIPFGKISTRSGFSAPAVFSAGAGRNEIKKRNIKIFFNPSPFEETRFTLKYSFTRCIAGGSTLRLGLPINDLPVYDGHLYPHRGPLLGGNLEEVLRKYSQVRKPARGKSAQKFLLL
jgi:hypothetical protein